MQRLAILASGTGSNFEALLQAATDGRIPAHIALVLTNNPNAGVAHLAEKAGIPLWARSHKDFSGRAEFDSAMLAAMESASVTAVVLAGYMRLLSPHFIRAYAGKILNIHPSLLPAFAGGKGIADSLDYGVRLAGCSVHFVTEEMDTGPIIIQAALPVLPGENTEALHGRIRQLEHRIYPQAVHWFARERLLAQGRHVRLLPAGQDESAVPAAPSPDGCLINPPLEYGF